MPLCGVGRLPGRGRRVIVPTEEDFQQRQVLVELMRKALFLEGDLRVLGYDREAKAMRRRVIKPLHARLAPANAALQGWPAPWDDLDDDPGLEEA